MRRYIEVFDYRQNTHVGVCPSWEKIKQELQEVGMFSIEIFWNFIFFNEPYKRLINTTGGDTLF